MTRVDDDTKKALHLNRIVAAWTAHCQTPTARQGLSEISPCEGSGIRRRRVVRIQEARTLLQSDTLPPFAALHTVDVISKRLAKGLGLELDDIIKAGQVCGALYNLRVFFKATAEASPNLSADAVQLPDLAHLAESILPCFDSENRLVDDASDKLLSLRSRSRSMHARIKRTMRSMLHDVDIEDALQDDFYTVRNDRYVLPVRTDGKRDVRGIIHGRSGSGQTLYVEPEALIQSNNELKMLESEIRHEETRILHEMMTDIREHIDEIEAGLTVSAALDTWVAAALFADEFGAVPAQECQESEQLFLHQARNPILSIQGKGVIKNDIVFPKDKRWLVISGPNAGGKSVTLNTLGCSLWLHAMGLPVFASEESRLPHVKGLVAIFGDRQDMEQDLSTFSGHVQTIVQSLEDCAPDWFFLIDELMDGTDPDQGAALGQAVLEQMAKLGASGAVTTHYRRLKEMASTASLFTNARVLFNHEKRVPTYVLEVGEAASSEPFAIARSANLEQAILDRANNILGGEFQDLQNLRRELGVEHERVIREREEVERERDELREQRNALEQEIQRVKDRSGEYVKRSAKRTLSQIDQALREVKEMTRALQSNPESQSARVTRRRLNELKEEVDAVANQRLEDMKGDECAVVTPAGSTPVWRVDDRVAVGNEKKTGRIIQIQKDRAEVEVGAIRIWLPLTQLGQAEPEKTRTKPQPRKDLKTTIVAEEDEGRAFELDIRGLRVDEGVQELDRVLDRAMLNNERHLRVIHGHGTAALKKAIRAYLRRSPYVAEFRPEEQEYGGDGATRVKIRDD